MTDFFNPPGSGYIWVSGTGWVSTSNFVGKVGPAGPPGPAGLPGPAGPIGPQGPPGSSQTPAVTPPAATGGLTAPTGYTMGQLVFSDYFPGPSLDLTKWFAGMAEPQYGAWRDQGRLPVPYTAMGNSNASPRYSQEYVDPAMIHVNNGLDLQLAPSTQFPTYSYKSGGISTWGKFSFPPGKRVFVQVRAKCDAGLAKGGWPAIWHLSGTGGEKDLFEGGYNALGDPLHTLAFNEQTAANRQDVTLETGADLTQGFNIWGMEYDPSVPRVRYYFNGTLWKEYTTPIALGPYVIILNHSMATTAAAGWHTTPVAGDTSTYHFYVSGVEAYAV